MATLNDTIDTSSRSTMKDIWCTDTTTIIVDDDDDDEHDDHDNNVEYGQRQHQQHQRLQRDGRLRSSSSSRLLLLLSLPWMVFILVTVGLIGYRQLVFFSRNNDNTKNHDYYSQKKQQQVLVEQQSTSQQGMPTTTTVTTKTKKTTKSDDDHGLNKHYHPTDDDDSSRGGSSRTNDENLQVENVMDCLSNVVEITNDNDTTTNNNSTNNINYYFVVLISLGRTGSSVTWNILSTLLTGQSSQCLEWTGYNYPSSYHFFSHDAKQYDTIDIGSDYSDSESDDGGGDRGSRSGGGGHWVDHFFCKLITKQVVVEENVDIDDSNKRGERPIQQQQQQQYQQEGHDLSGTGQSNKNNKEKKNYLLGFQWKAFGTIIDELNTPKQGLQRLSELFSSSSPPSPSSNNSNIVTEVTSASSSITKVIQGGGVIRLRRNLLDVYLSRLKHERVRNNHYNNLPSHCHKDDQKCLQQHVKATTTTTTAITTTNSEQQIEEEAEGEKGSGNGGNDSSGGNVGAGGGSGGIYVDVDAMMKFLTEWTESEDKVDDYLKQYNVPTVHVTYDKLYYPTRIDSQQQQQEGGVVNKASDSMQPNHDDMDHSISEQQQDEEEQNGESSSLLSEWNKIFQFLNWNEDEGEGRGRGRPVNLTFHDIMNATDLSPTTSSRYHKDIIQNYDQVRGKLQHTKFEYLLR